MEIVLPVKVDVPAVVQDALDVLGLAMETVTQVVMAAVEDVVLGALADVLLVQDVLVHAPAIAILLVEMDVLPLVRLAVLDVQEDVLDVPEVVGQIVLLLVLHLVAQHASLIVQIHVMDLHLLQ